MKLSTFLPVLPFIALLATSYSCNKDDNNNPTNTDTCNAGTGGKLTIIAYPKHHGKTIFNQSNYLDTVFVKFNTQDSPGENTSSYDTFFVGEAGEDHVHLTGLKCGKYYLFAAGYDTSIFQRVIGGIPFSTDTDSGEVNQTIPVTEGD